MALITSIAILFASRISNSQSSDQPLVWTTSAMEAIERNRSAPLWLGNRSSEMKTIQLMAAKGEYEPFQIVIKAPQDNLSNVNVTVSELTNSEGAVIDSQNITLYREHYIYVDRPSPQGLSANPTLGKGWYADGLIPFVNPETQANLTGAELEAVPFNLKAGNNQPIWVDVFVPRDARAGQYQGIFTVT
ncbi:MAG: glycoside hydrolase domain-containing protein, partial [Waterburya sp.]